MKTCSNQHAYSLLQVLGVIVAVVIMCGATIIYISHEIWHDELRPIARLYNADLKDNKVPAGLTKEQKIKWVLDHHPEIQYKIKPTEITHYMEEKSDGGLITGCGTE